MILDFATVTPKSKKQWEMASTFWVKVISNVNI